MIPHAPVPPLPTLQRMKDALLRTADWSSVELHGLEPFSAPLESLAWVLHELRERTATAAAGAYHTTLQTSCADVARLYLFRFLDETFTRSGPYCAAESLAQLGGLGAALFGGKIDAFLLPLLCTH